VLVCSIWSDRSNCESDCGVVDIFCVGSAGGLRMGSGRTARGTRSMMMMADLQGKQRESNLRNPVRH